MVHFVPEFVVVCCPTIPSDDLLLLPIISSFFLVDKIQEKKANNYRMYPGVETKKKMSAGCQASDLFRNSFIHT